MTNKQAKAEITKHAKAIVKILKEYSPNSDYLSVAYVNGCIIFNNDYWHKDIRRLTHFTTYMLKQRERNNKNEID